MKILNLVIELNRAWDERETSSALFIISGDVASPESALRGAVHDFINSKTEQAEQALRYACNDFNWGDVFSSIPDEYFIKRGLTPFADSDVFTVAVNHDEVLDNRHDEE